MTRSRRRCSLAIVRRIINSHGGTVSVTDAEEGGAMFVSTWLAAAP